MLRETKAVAFFFVNVTLGRAVATTVFTGRRMNVFCPANQPHRPHHKCPPSSANILLVQHSQRAAVKLTGHHCRVKHEAWRARVHLGAGQMSRLKPLYHARETEPGLLDLAEVKRPPFLVR